MRNDSAEILSSLFWKTGQTRSYVGNDNDSFGSLLMSGFASSDLKYTGLFVFTKSRE